MPAIQSPSLASALARLETRWGSAAVRIGSGLAGDAPRTNGALALAPTLASTPTLDPAPTLAVPTPAPVPMPPRDGVLSTGFSRLDTLLGMGGLPHGASASFRGGRSSGKTALALHCLARAQAQGAIVAFLDFAQALDPLEAASRGVDLRWLLVVRPASVDEGFAIATALLTGRQIDLLVLDLPPRLAVRHEAGLRRLAAHARRQSIRLIVLEPVAVGRQIHGALAESVALRLELEQRAWLRAGRDVVGRCVSVSVAKNRFGPPGRKAEIEIRYLTHGERQPAADRFAARDS